jgi:hypothetical protein
MKRTGGVLDRAGEERDGVPFPSARVGDRQPQRFGLHRKSMIVGHERREIAVEELCGGEVNRIKTAQDRACGQCGGAIEDVDIDPDLMRPGQLSTGVSNRETTAGQDGANNLHPGESAGDSGLGPVPAKVPSQGVGFGFSLDKLHQGGGIQIYGHYDSSLIAASSAAASTP